MNKEVNINDDEYYYKIIRENIRYFRLKNNLTQQQLADMIDMSREYICDIENDSRNKHLTIAVLGRIADAMNVDIANFFAEKQTNPLTKEDIETLGYACGEIRKCFEKGFNKSLNNEPLEEDKDIPLIPDDELYKLAAEMPYRTYKDDIDYNFKVLQEKINQVVEEFNEYRKEHNE